LDNKAPDAFRTISEVADELDLPQHVLRFWESRFRDIKPMKRGGGRRYYRPDDVELLRGIRHLLYGEGYTIRGVQRILREQGAKFVQAVWMEGAPQPPHGGTEDDEFIAETVLKIEPDTESSSLRGRLSSLIGRDLRDRQGGGEARREPPFKSAPEPRVELTDRAIHGTGFAATEPEPPMAEQRSSMPVIQPALATANSRLARDDLQKLHAVLHELAECRKLIAAAAAHAE
jgi:DNA-binding transcriptional MerR regulator